MSAVRRGVLTGDEIVAGVPTKVVSQRSNSLLATNAPESCVLS